MATAQSKQNLKLHILDIVGHVYMQHHSLVAGPHYKVEDARVAIKVSVASHRFYSYSALLIGCLSHDSRIGG